MTDRQNADKSDSPRFENALKNPEFKSRSPRIITTGFSKVTNLHHLFGRLIQDGTIRPGNSVN
jgi:hypothetical protein